MISLEFSMTFVTKISWWMIDLEWNYDICNAVVDFCQS